ncbi:MAG TPA: glycosyltransferase family 4 protein [Kiritimatiellia bacterium]|nr:glycosyltransferase family 4 protein [Kiritimatiellia bacterium]
MDRAPTILTNMAFRQSRTWIAAATSICRGDETPDELPPLRQALRLLGLRRKFDAVVTMGPRPSLAYGLLCAILRVPSKQILTEVFLDAARPDSLRWRLKTALFGLVARRALGILTNSSAEVALIARRFGLPEDRLRFVPMHTTIAEPQAVAENDGSVLSIGRTLRDLDALVAAARRVAAPFVVVAGAADRLPEPLPANVRVLRDVPLAESHALLRRAAVVAIPLLPAERSTGQVVLFEAMALGKPVVATRAVGTVDYVRDGENGLLVAPGDPAALADAIQRLLQNPDLARHLAATALEDCRTRWLPDIHAQAKIEAVRELWFQTQPKTAPA